jgi:hypothetical protein
MQKNCQWLSQTILLLSVDFLVLKSPDCNCFHSHDIIECAICPCPIVVFAAQNSEFMEVYFSLKFKIISFFSLKQSQLLDGICSIWWKKRMNKRISISFHTAFFHPKVLHFHTKVLERTFITLNSLCSTSGFWKGYITILESMAVPLRTIHLRQFISVISSPTVHFRQLISNSSSSTVHLRQFIFSILLGWFEKSLAVTAVTCGIYVIVGVE